jgi:hypothetical protein
MRKLVLILVAMMSVSICDLHAQTDSLNIWVVTNQILVEYGEKDPDANPFPGMETISWIGEEKKEVFAWPFFIFANGGEIDDPNFVLPYSEKLDYYLFGILAPHKPMHLLFFKERQWVAVNMKKPLLDIMNQCVALCEKLPLTSDEVIYVFKEVLRFHEGDLQDTGGVPIM